LRRPADDEPDARSRLTHPRAEPGRISDTHGAHTARVIREPIRPGGVPLSADACHYAAAGVPIALYGAGPRSIEEANAHRADERVPLADLFRATEVVALTLADLLG